ncbi:hypothetical protein [Nitrosomonas sp. Nm34]|nr:hypothetical protein [Nitrosomonas sp. Nm34]SFI37794.1 hypothetical protein SAMN05428978_1007112 [Nitrosomonas sp. Nm34]
MFQANLLGDAAVGTNLALPLIAGNGALQRLYRTFASHLTYHTLHRI